MHPRLTSLFLISLLILIGCVRSQQAINQKGRNLGPGDGGDGKTCTMMDCADGFSIQISAADGTIDAAVYDLWLDKDGKPDIQCTITVNPGSQEGYQGNCEGVLVALGANGPSSIQYRSDETNTKSVLITLARNAQIVGQKSVTLEYQQFEANGPGCGPVCNSAKEIALTAGL